MRIEGNLSKWNDDRGYGFITPKEGGPAVFVHISSFPKDGIRPALGEKLSFEVETDSNGKKRAKNLLCLERPIVRRPPPATSRKPASQYRNERPSVFTRVIPLFVLVGLFAYGYSKYAHRGAALTANVAQPGMQALSQAYRCDGRTHCSQMTSCAEATFFLRNCPDVQMDGNNDGVPCEQQWCTQ